MKITIIALKLGLQKWTFIHESSKEFMILKSSVFDSLIAYYLADIYAMAKLLRYPIVFFVKSMMLKETSQIIKQLSLSSHLWTRLTFPLDIKVTSSCCHERRADLRWLNEMQLTPCLLWSEILWCQLHFCDQGYTMPSLAPMITA